MLFLNFLLKAILISLSGVMAPGPITAVTVSKGTRSPYAGVWIALGHALVEFPIMFLLFLGLDFLFRSTRINGLIAFIGGFFILFMGIQIFKDMKATIITERKDERSPFFLGIILSAGNAYFLIWWAFVGAKLIQESIQWGLMAFLCFAVVHWLCDLVWLCFLSYTSYRGGKFYGKKFQRILFAVCGISLIFFGLSFILGAFRFWLKIT